MKHSFRFIVLSLIIALSSCNSTPEKAIADNVTDALNNNGRINIENLVWTRTPQDYTVCGDTLTITTAPHTDLWQRTYYHFRNDNAPVPTLPKVTIVSTSAE